MDIVIIGCGAAGGTAAQFARKQDRKASITVYEKGSYPQYSKCGLPYALSGQVSFDSLIEFSQEWFKKARIDLYLQTGVSRIDFENKLVVTSAEKREYDALIISTGMTPSVPFPYPPQGIHFLRTLPDAQGVKKRMKQGKNAIIIGGGPTGLETAEALVAGGMQVTLIEYLPNVLLTMLDEDMAHLVRQQLDEQRAMRLMTNHEVIEVTEGCSVCVKNRDTGETSTLLADLVIATSGNTPLVDLAPRGMADQGIIVNERCETLFENVYAAGDCTQYVNSIGRRSQVGLGSIAVRQGKVAGINAAGGQATMPPLLNSRVTKIFGIEIAAVGPLEKHLEGVTIGKYRGLSHPDYLPGEPVVVKVAATPEGKLLAGQIIGPGATQRINTLAAAISCSMNLQDFCRMETAYAPAVSPVFDPATVACEIALRRL